MSREVICASCQLFSLKDAPAGTPAGSGLCSGGQLPPVNPIVAWDGRACVLFVRSGDWHARERWIQRKRDEARTMGEKQQ